MTKRATPAIRRRYWEARAQGRTQAEAAEAAGMSTRWGEEQEKMARNNGELSVIATTPETSEPSVYNVDDASTWAILGRWFLSGFRPGVQKHMDVLTDIPLPPGEGIAEARDAVLCCYFEHHDDEANMGTRLRSLYDAIKDAADRAGGSDGHVHGQSRYGLASEL